MNKTRLLLQCVLGFSLGLVAACVVNNDGDDSDCMSECDEAQVSCEGECDDDDDECVAGCQASFDDCEGDCD